MTWATAEIPSVWPWHWGSNASPLLVIRVKMTAKDLCYCEAGGLGEG